MALRPDSEDPRSGMPPGYAPRNAPERPGDWGWHGAWGRAGRAAGWVTTGILLLMITSTHYNFSGAAWLIAVAAVLVAALTYDNHRRRNSWRSR